MDEVSLDSLAADPNRVHEVAPSAAAELLTRLAALQSLLLVRLLAGNVHISPTCPADDRLLTIPEVAERLSVPLTYAYELARRRELPTVHVGKKYARVPLNAFEKWLAVQQLDSHSTPAYSPRHRRS